MSRSQTCVVVGASHAGVQAALSLRKGGWQGDVVLIGAEPQLPYHRPPLSKTLLLQAKGAEDILLKPEAVYARERIDLHLGRTVRAIDRASSQVILDSGEHIEYSKLILATGCRVRPLDLPGSKLAGVHYLRTVDDVQGILDDIPHARNMVVVGGGYIGLEAAASLRKSGLTVTVLEAADRLLARVTGSEVSEFFRQMHEQEGVDVRTNVAVHGFDGVDAVEAVVVDNDQIIPADLVIIGVGVLPNIELANDAGLVTSNGIVVNEFTNTSDYDIYAIGDCASFVSHWYGREVRLESVQNAVDQAKVAAASICGNPVPYTALPWFWSDQYDVKLQTVGLSQGHDQVLIRGDMTGGRSFSAWYFRRGSLIAVDAINDARSYVIGTKLIQAGISPPESMLVDTDCDLRKFLA